MLVKSAKLAVICSSAFAGCIVCSLDAYAQQVTEGEQPPPPPPIGPPPNAAPAPEPPAPPSAPAPPAPVKAPKQDQQALVGCDGYQFCLIGGALLASFSLTMMDHASDRGGSTAHKMVSIAMPMLGFRYVPPFFNGSGLVSLDFLAYTGLLPSQSLGPGPSDVSGCHSGGNKFETLLPCEGNATLTPQLAFAFPAVTVTPTAAFSAVTAALTYGWARTNNDSAFNPFVGILVTIGAAQLSVGLGNKSTTPTTAGGG